MKTMRSITKFYTLYPDETDDRIAELEREVESLRKKLKHENEVLPCSVSELMTVNRLQKDVDYLEIALRKQRRKRATIENEVSLLRSEVELLTKALNSPALKEENLVEMMMQQLEMRTEELHMSRTLIMELQNVAFADSEDKIVTQAKSILYENNHLKKKLMDMEVELLKTERKNLETAKHSDQMDRVYEKKEESLKLLKRKLREEQDKSDEALAELENKWEQKTAQRIAHQETMMEMLNMQINDLQARAHAAEMGGGAMLPPLSPQGTDSLIIADLRKQLEARNGTIAELQRQADFGIRSEKSTSSRGRKRRQAQDAQQDRIREMDAQILALQEELQTVQQVTGEEIKSLRAQNARLAALLQNAEASGLGGFVTLRTELDSAKKYYEEKLEKKDEGVAKLQQSLKTLSKDLNGSDQLNRICELVTQNRDLLREKEKLMKAYQAEVVKRKKFYNLCEELKGKVRVFVRVRPFLPSEDSDAKSCLSFSDEFTVSLQKAKKGKEFIFDRVFKPEEDQEVVFNDVSNLIQSAVDGFNVSIFAYGQTGSGKTYTLLGTDRPGTEGITLRSFEKIFEIINQQKDKLDFNVSVYMLELYNDKLLDLLREEGPTHAATTPLEIRKDNKNMVYVHGASLHHAHNVGDLLNIFHQGLSNRHVAETKLNVQSSRSHLIITIQIEGKNKLTRQTSKGKLSIIDLAGSERISKILPPQGNDLFKAKVQTVANEANSINLSLSSLGDVISALTSEQSYVPYRNNKLTMLMQDSVGGNAKTLMFVNVSPASKNVGETLNSLSYGARVKLIKNDPSKTSEAEEVLFLRKQQERLETELHQATKALEVSTLENYHLKHKRSSQT